MSPPRSTSSSGPSSHRRLILAFALLLSVILLGTITVLSSVSYYLAIPSGAYLTEEEVPWTGKDVITELHDRRDLSPSRMQARQEWEEIGTGSDTASSPGTLLPMPPSHKAEDPDRPNQIEGVSGAGAEDDEVPFGQHQGVGSGEKAVMGTDTLPAVWDELADEEQEAKAGAFTPGSTGGDASSAGGGEGQGWAPTGSGSSDMDMMEEDEVSDWEGGWGQDGLGSGGYWMRAGWDGQVRESRAWESLYNVTTR